MREDIPYRAKRCGKLLAGFMVKEMREAMAYPRSGSYIRTHSRAKYSKRHDSDYFMFSRNEFGFNDRDFSALYDHLVAYITNFFQASMDKFNSDNITVKSDALSQYLGNYFRDFWIKRRKSKTMDFDDFRNVSSLSEIEYISYNQMDYEMCLFMRFKIIDTSKRRKYIYSWRIDLGRPTGKEDVIKSAPFLKDILSEWESNPDMQQRDMDDPAWAGGTWEIGECDLSS